MPRSKRTRITTKRKTSTSSNTSQQSSDDSSVSDLLAQFEEEFAIKLKQYDELLESKLFSLNKRKEWLKVKYLHTMENVRPKKDPSASVNSKEIRSAPEVRKQSLRARTRTLSSSQDTNSCETMSRTRLSKKVLMPSSSDNMLMPTSSGNFLQTPVGFTVNSQSSLMTPLVTPKVTPGTPVSVLRLPRLGELAISMTGSPLLVAATVQNKRANINVPLGQGRIISINGDGNLNPYDVPELDNETKQQLQTLHENLQALLNMNTKR